MLGFWGSSLAVNPEPKGPYHGNFLLVMMLAGCPPYDRDLPCCTPPHSDPRLPLLADHSQGRPNQQRRVSQHPSFPDPQLLGPRTP